MSIRKGLLLGIGNPLLDISAVVNDEFLKKYSLKADDAILAQENHLKNLYKDLVENFKISYTAGGSVQNSLRVAQWILNMPNVCVYFGCVGKDDYAEILKESAERDGVKVSYQVTEEVETGTCAVLITGHHRSLCANLGAANKFTIEHTEVPHNKTIIEKAGFYYISGFFLSVSPPTIMGIAEFACSKDRPFIMNLSAPFVSECYYKDLMDVMPYIDVLFGNESEALSLSKKLCCESTDFTIIGKKLCCLPKENKTRPRVVIITQGRDPVLLFEDFGKKITEFPVEIVPPELVVDTNGAGDAFAGGFIAQYIQKKPLDVCIICGIWAARHVIQNPGCTFKGEPDFAEYLKKVKHSRKEKM